MVGRVRKAVAQLATSSRPADAPHDAGPPPQSPSQRAASPTANGASDAPKHGVPSAAQDMLSLNGFCYLSAALDQGKVDGVPVALNAAAVGDEEAQEAVVRLMQSSLTAAVERVVPQLPSLDLQSAIVPSTQELELGCCREPPRSKPPVPPDEVRPCHSSCLPMHTCAAATRPKVATAARARGRRPPDARLDCAVASDDASGCPCADRAPLPCRVPEERCPGGPGHPDAAPVSGAVGGGAARGGTRGDGGGRGRWDRNVGGGGRGWWQRAASGAGQRRRGRGGDARR